MFAGISTLGRAKIVDPAITLHAAAASFPVPTGSSASVDGPAALTAWRSMSYVTPDVVIRFDANGTTVIGDGTATGQLGVWGIKAGQADLLGVLGLAMGGVAPQIPIASASAGYAIIVQGAAMYEDIVIGGVSGTVTPTGGKTVTVTMHRIENIG